jgi:hypothetical protein
MYKLHAVMYPKNKFTYNEARSKFSKDFSDFKLDHYTNYENFWRMTTEWTTPWLKRNSYTVFRTKVLPDGVQLNLAYKKGSKK